MTDPQRLPLLHANTRSSRITSEEVREIFAEESSRFLRCGLDPETYVEAVMFGG